LKIYHLAILNWSDASFLKEGEAPTELNATVV
jgi:hypothetical protein